MIENVALNNIKLYPSDQCRGYQGIYFKSWIGEEVGHPPNGGGGGYGYCRNVSVNNVYMENIDRPVALTAGYVLPSADCVSVYAMYIEINARASRISTTSTASTNTARSSGRTSTLPMSRLPLRPTAPSGSIARPPSRATIYSSTTS